MAGVKIQLVVLVTLAAVAVLCGPVSAARGTILRQPVDKRLDIRSFLNPRGWNGLLCLPDVTQLLEEHEGRHDCAYDHANGFRAVGVGYNLDDDVKQRKSELSTVLADYKKVYNGDTCLNDLQISTLLLVDAKRDLNRAAKNVKPLDDFCCAVQAVFADIQHGTGSAENFPQRDLEEFIEQTALKDYKSAAHALKKTEWCSKEENKKRCRENSDLIAKGC